MRIQLGRKLPASVVSAVLGVTTLGAQVASSNNSHEDSRNHAPVIATGFGAGAIRFSDGRTESAITATLEYSPNSWLTFTAAPGFGRMSRAGASTTGPTDVPLTAGASYALSDVRWSPSISGSLYSNVSIGDSTSAVGLGRTVFGASGALSGWATERLNVAIAASRPLAANGGNASVDLESAYSLGVATTTLGFSSEMGRADSAATLARSVAGGLAIAVDGPLTLTIDASHGLTTGAPSWAFSVGLGTAFAGVSPIGPSSPLRRLRKQFGSRLSSTSGYTKGGSGSKSCKSAGTC
jgi:hypothetical protein